MVATQQQPTLATPRACRWTVPCPVGDCTGYALSPKGNASWKRGDFGPGPASILTHCSGCKSPVSVPKP
jgi:hypothetical protein